MNINYASQLPVVRVRPGKFFAPRFQAQNYTKLHKVATDEDEATMVFQLLSLPDNICYKLETPKRSPICVYVSVCNVSCDCV